MNDVSLKRRADAVVYSRAAISADSTSAETRSVDVLASTEALDSHGTILRQNWDLSRYRENPVVLYAHDSSELPIGTASNVRVENGALRATLTFSTVDLNPQAEQVWLNVKGGVLRGISVGFWPRTVRFEKHDDREVLVLDDLELLEISVVPVGSNPETLAEMRARALADSNQGGTERPAPLPKPQTSPSPAASAEPTTRAAGKDQNDMSDSENTQFPQAITLALGLPVGTPESEVLARATTLAQERAKPVNEAVRVVSEIERIVGAVGAEAIGAVRALKADQEQLVAVRGELNQTKSALARNAFDGAIASGRKERKLTPHAIKDFQARFDAALTRGESGDDVVAELQGFIRLAAPFATEARQVSQGEGGLQYQGKTYAQMTFRERSKLADSDPELWRQMKNDFEATQL